MIFSSLNEIYLTSECPRAHSSKEEGKHLETLFEFMEKGSIEKVKLIKVVTEPKRNDSLEFIIRSFLI